MTLTIPKNKTELKNMMRSFNETLTKDAHEYMAQEESLAPITERDTYSVETRLNLFHDKIHDMKGLLAERMIKINTLFDASEYLTDTSAIYNTEGTRMKNELNSIKNTNDVNKRLIDFYDKEYNFKSSIKKYFKYIYFFLIGLLLLIIIYKKLHKNKKILAFLGFLVIFPLFILVKIFDKTMGIVGHFKLDVLYSLFIFIIIGLTYGGFFISKKILTNVHGNNINFKGMPSISKNMPSISKNMPSMSKNMPSISKDNITKNIKSIAENSKNKLKNSLSPTKT
jgi:hypothetical protein